MPAPRIDRLDKNLLINGNFDFWQRNATFTSLAQFAYGPDRWHCVSGSVTSTVTSSQSSGLLESPNCLRWVAGSTSSGFNMGQSVENVFVRDVVGKYVTFSVKARVNSGNTRTYSAAIHKNATANVSNGGSWSAVATSSPVALSTSFQQIYVTGLIPDDGSANGLKFMVYDHQTGLATDQVEITNACVVKTVLGVNNVPNDLVRAGRDYAEEFRLCQRYYQRGLQHRGVAGAFSTANVGIRTPLIVTMRANPVVSQISGTSLTNCLDKIGAGLYTPTSILSLGPMSPDAIYSDFTGAFTLYQPVDINTDIIQATAEL